MCLLVAPSLCLFCVKQQRITTCGRDVCRSLISWKKCVSARLTASTVRGAVRFFGSIVATNVSISAPSLKSLRRPTGQRDDKCTFRCHDLQVKSCRLGRCRRLLTSLTVWSQCTRRSLVGSRTSHSVDHMTTCLRTQRNTWHALKRYGQIVERSQSQRTLREGRALCARTVLHKVHARGVTAIVLD